MEINIDLINRRVSNVGVAGRRRSTAQFLVLDRNYRILIGDIKQDDDLFPSDLIGTVRSMTQDWGEDISFQPEEIALASPSLIVRVFPMQGRQGPGEWTMGVYAEPYRRRPTLAERAEAFGLSASQYEMVRLLADGLSETDTAGALGMPPAEFEAALGLIIRKVNVKSPEELLAIVGGKRV